MDALEDEAEGAYLSSFLDHFFFSNAKSTFSRGVSMEKVKMRRAHCKEIFHVFTAEFRREKYSPIFSR